MGDKEKNAYRAAYWGGRSYSLVVLVALLQLSFFPGVSIGKLRGIKTGDKVPQFSATELSGAPYHYKHGIGKVVVAAFLSAGQKQSALAAQDLQKIARQLDRYSEQIQYIIITNNKEAQDYFKSTDPKAHSDFRILLDTEYKLWGLFGVIVTPTLVITDKTDMLKWAKSGYSYDFAPAARLHIEQALGLTDATQEDAVSVQTLKNTTERSKLKRHLQMAKTLEAKGRLESAILQALEAQKLDPNSINVKLQLAQLYCKTSKGAEAIKTVGKAEPKNRAQKAQVKLILGWSNRLLGKLDAAQTLLFEAARLDPKSARVLFELGKVYLATGEKDKAIEAYQKALTLVLGE
ncbi:MAG: tetratricopeptide repeat protein [Planctomycetota bacterium]|jgi:tetratricopeptide (TPR) repeat protein